MPLFGKDSFFGSFLDKEKLEDTKKEDKIQSNQIATHNTDGAIEIDNVVSRIESIFDFSYNTQAELLNTYREISNFELVDYAVEDVVNEMVSFSEDENPVELDMSGIDDMSQNIKDKIYENWEAIVSMLELKETIHARVRQFYIDGRLAYQKVIDEDNVNAGLLDIIELDPRCITKVRNRVIDPQKHTITGIDEYFVYDESIINNQETNVTKTFTPITEALRINPESITYVTSGIIDSVTGFAISWLHKAIKPANMLRLMENSLVVYRIIRAPERRIFNVDTGTLPKAASDAYLRRVHDRYQNHMTFNPDKGVFDDKRHLQTMQEDYWFAKSSTGRGTEVSTLPGGENLGQIEDILYFQKKLYKALNIPVSRLEPDSIFAGGRTSEISRDELKFSKFVSKIRKRFNLMFLDLLRTQLILTNVITVEEWDDIKQRIEFHYSQDIYLEELKQMDIEQTRLDLLTSYQPYVGKYISNKFVRQNILKQSETDMEDIDKEIADEKTDPKYIDVTKDPNDFGDQRL